MNLPGSYCENGGKITSYWSFLSGKTLFASYGRECLQYVPDELQHINVSKPPHLQGDHEEADTLIAFHVANITESDSYRHQGF